MADAFASPGHDFEQKPQLGWNFAFGPLLLNQIT
jgi:hypothetical protein